MRVNEKIERITPDALISGIDIGKTKCCARFFDYRELEVYHKVWFDKTENLDAIGCQITAAMYKENKTDVIISFEPTGHYWLNIDKYFKDNDQETVLMPTYTVKQAKEMHDQNPTKSDSKDNNCLKDWLKLFLVYLILSSIDVSADDKLVGFQASPVINI